MRTKSKLRTIGFLIYFLFLLFKLSAVTVSASVKIDHLQFKRLTAFNNFSSNEVTRILQDKKGFIWIATQAGLYRYDGYRIRTYRDNLQQPDLLVSNQIKCIVEDHEQNIWIGTDKGLNMLDCKTGIISKIDEPLLQDRAVWDIVISADNSVWVGLDVGVFQIKPDRKHTLLHNWAVGGESMTAVKTILFDKQSRLWIGTWNKGLFRYDAQQEAFVSYPAFNSRNSVHVLFQDSYEQIWAGTWDEGLYKLEVSDSPSELKWKNYRHNAYNGKSLSDNIIYCISEETDSHTLWVGTRSGLSILDMNTGTDDFVNYLPDSETRRLPYNEVDGIIRDQSGMMWLGMMGGGLYSVNMHRLPVEACDFSTIKRKLFSPSVRSMLIDSDQVLWMGVGTYGLVICDPETNTPIFYTDHPSFKGHDHLLHTINCMIERSASKQIWFATWGNGIYVHDKKQPGKQLRSIHLQNTPWLPDDYVFSMCEDRSDNVWIGCRNGLAVQTSDNLGINLSDLKTTCGQTLHQTYYSILQSSDGLIWLGTDQGIIRIKGSVLSPDKMQIDLFNRKNKNLFNDRILCLYEDQHGILWAGSDGGGLMRFNKTEERFDLVSKHYGIQADAILSIQEDKIGNLWLGTNKGLLHLRFNSDRSEGFSTVYTVSDGLLNDSYLTNAFVSDKNGQFYVGGHNGYNRFYPEKIEQRFTAPSVVITDLFIYNTSFDHLEAPVRNRITSKYPGYSDLLTLQHDQNHLGIEFSALSFANPAANTYAYRLEGYDTDWQYTDASNRMANYSNLPAGSYVFYLKGSDGNGVWNDMEQALHIRILPPFWKTTWAYLFYILLIILSLLGSMYGFRKRMERKRLFELQMMEQAKSDEMNHLKQQFFTNITHELLTPLTILSASVDELRIQAPHLQSYYAVMGSNINRLIRLLQQILEFRKSESGSLKLKVHEADLVAFVCKEIESFQPLMKKKSIQFNFHCKENKLLAYFDPDKLDKILYNLLSNASKYNHEGGRVDVTLSYNDSEENVRIQVKDNGDGISYEMQKNLFKRFYEGDYRRFKTTGTGIGLSLTKDLAELHKGSVSVESKEGEGAIFSVVIPVNREAYDPDQIEAVKADQAIEALPVEDASINSEPEIPADQTSTILLVEDNEELLLLMSGLLNREYHVLCAPDGKKAIELITSKESDIDLVVSDIMMPEVDGIELCQFIKENIDYCHIPVLLLTAKNQEEDRIEAYETGADGFISKPFNLSLLHARIRNLLKKRQRTATDFKKQLVFETQELNYTSLDEEFLQRAIECVQRHLDNVDFDQQMFIDEMNTSKSTLYKKLKSLTGLNTSAFIRNIRLKTACKIIEEKKQIRISELAYAVGFNDPKYFSLCFKKEFGLLPTDYIEQYLSGKEE